MKVIIVDDEPAMLLVLQRMLKKIDGVEVVGSFQRTDEALDFIQSNEVELAILDIIIDRNNGLQLAHRLRSLRKDLQIVFTTSSTEYALDAYDVYPLDYIVKPISSVRLAHTIARASNSRKLDDTAEQVHVQEVEEQSDGYAAAGEQRIGLTMREKEVLQRIAAGQSNEQIAQQLEISLSTVKVHTRNVFHKLEVHNRVSAVVRAQQLSLLEG